MARSPFMSAREAADALDIRLPTLYAYVSRGLVRSESDSGSRTRRYLRGDVEALLARKAQRRDPSQAVEGALDWGAPILETALTSIADGRLCYRGKDAVDLATAWPFERVTTWLWLGDDAAPWPRPLSCPYTGRIAALHAQLAHLDPVVAAQVLLPVAAVDDPGAYDLRPAAVCRTGGRILALLAAIATRRSIDGPMSEHLAAAWAPDRAAAALLLDVALVLGADHELNTSAFTARCVASTTAHPYDVVTAALSALRGARHGGHCERVEALWREAGTPAHARTCLAARLRRGESVPGFAQPLYPSGDPRGRALLDLVYHHLPGSGAIAMARALEEAGRELFDGRPTIDFGLVALAQALALPPGAPLTLFALGRTAGWIGHALEQYQRDRLIRPRARYTGPQPMP